MFDDKIRIIREHKLLNKNYDINIIFSYFKILDKKYLCRSKNNLVVHASNLPKGRGMSPLTWQILKGKSSIIFSLIEANENMDEGRYYFKKKVKIPKYYLFDEIKSSYAPRIRSTINDGLENVLIDLSNLEEVGEDSVEMVGEFAELIEEMGSPFKMGFVVEGEDADMWKNLDGCEEAEIFDSLDDAKSQMT